MQASSYAAFLRSLFHKISQGRPPNQYFWRDEANISFYGNELQEELQSLQVRAAARGRRGERVVARVREGRAARWPRTCALRVPPRAPPRPLPRRDPLATALQKVRPCS